MLNYADASCLSRPDIMSLPFAVYFFLLEALDGFESENKHLGIIRSVDLDSHLFSTYAINQKRCRDISHRIAENHEYLWPTYILSRKYYYVFTFAVVV